MQDRPSVDELLEAVAGFLHDDVMPNTAGRLSFHARVSGNVLQWLRRELAMQEEHLEREWAGLDQLLEPEPRPAHLASAFERLTARNEILARRIRDGEADAPPFRQALFEHLRTVTRDKLAVTNPGLLEQA
jgi:hypothetical protein